MNKIYIITQTLQIHLIENYLLSISFIQNNSNMKNDKSSIECVFILSFIFILCSAGCCCCLMNNPLKCYLNINRLYFFNQTYCGGGRGR